MSDTVLIDPLGRKIILHDRTWFGHVIKGHPEVAPFRKLIEDAIAQPFIILISSSDSNCRVYYGSGPTDSISIAVIADVVSGFVKTAYLARKPLAGDIEWS